MRTLFLKAENVWWRTLRHALAALLLLTVCVFASRAGLTFLLGRLPSNWELIGVSLLLSLLMAMAMRWNHNRRMRRTIVNLQDSALW